ncbi:MAG TPA: branched-chain amino acid ABC transporter permease, partial [Nitriliruptorales bacterium]
LVLFVIIGAGLLVQRKTLQRSEDSGGVSWDAAEEQRAVPPQLMSVPGIRIARYAFIAIGLIALAIFPFVASTRTIVLSGVIALNAIVGLSVLVLTGWAGQVSLGQVGFAGIGAVIGAAISATIGWPFWIAVPLAAALTAGFAVLIGIPALRIKGLFLLVSTFAFAIVVSAVLFNDRYFGWAIPDAVERPSLFLLDFEDERSMYFLCVAALIAAIVVVLNLRRSRPGRILIAVRENDTNLQAFGVSAFRAKLVAFAVSGALAGFSGAIFVHLQRGISADSFLPQRSVDLFLYAVVGGITSIGGVVMGTAAFSSLNFFFGANVIIQFFGASMLTLILLYAEPGGLIAVVNNVRDSVLRIVAQRRQMIVPSLFADVDPEALHARLVPLAARIPGAGLAALGPRIRFSLASELYAGSGERFLDKLKPKKQSDEAALYAAAATAAEEAAEGSNQP